VNHAWIGQGAAISCALITIFFGVPMFRWVRGIEAYWPRRIAAWVVVMVFVSGASVIWLAVAGIVDMAMR
jgi:hypothetical protein